MIVEALIEIKPSKQTKPPDPKTKKTKTGRTSKRYLKEVNLYIINEAKKNCVKTIKSQYIPTEKNIPIQNFLPECGFKKNNDFWVYDLNNPFKMPDFITTKIE